jgi:arylsulfatase A-like enzyme
MNRRIPIVILVLILVLIWGCGHGEEHEQPNFIIIYTDDQQFDALGLYNDVVITPNIDEFARRGLQFLDAHVTFSLCSPSRATLLTGQYGSSNGVLGLGSSLIENIPVLPESLRDNGYTTALSGKWHLGQLPDSLGFEFVSYFHANGSYYNRKVIDNGDTLYPSIHVDRYGVERSIDFLQKQAESDQPFFLFHCPQTPHMNGKLIWDAQDSTKRMYRVGEMPVPANHLDDLENKPEYLQTVRNRRQAMKYGYPDSIAIQEHTRDYYSVVTELDGFLGELFKTIDELGLMKNTYVIFMSDNGWMLGDHGFTSKVLPYDRSTHVPFWICGPDVQTGENLSLVSNLDIFCTVLDLAGIPFPDEQQGRSLTGILNGEDESVRDHFIYEGLGVYGHSQYNLTMITGVHRYIETYTSEELLEIDFQELYDRKNDIDEMFNIAGDEEGQVRSYVKEIESFKQQE